MIALPAKIDAIATRVVEQFAPSEAPVVAEAEAETQAEAAEAEAEESAAAPA